MSSQTHKRSHHREPHHAGDFLLFNSPLSPSKAHQLIQTLGLSPQQRVLDVGCGQGEFLLRLVEATGAWGLGIDLNQDAIQKAQLAAKTRTPGGSPEFRAADMQKEAWEDGTFDAALCIGSTHAFGIGDQAYPNALQAMSRLVKPSGLLLIGECYWKQPPPQEYLALLGEPSGISRTHGENVWLGQEHGLIPLYAATSNQDEWDHFEWSHISKLERQAAAHPNDPQWRKKLERGRAWRDGYLRWGRTTMGFGFYIFQKPAASE